MKSGPEKPFGLAVQMLAAAATSFGTFASALRNANSIIQMFSAACSYYRISNTLLMFLCFSSNLSAQHTRDFVCFLLLFMREQCVHDGAEQLQSVQN